ncbi:hypothetical protein DIE10_29155 [Burkholderia sp. Bp9011]|nr:hypothetical protein DIE10_29155 [Burkholderia sp. Bp9011]
MRSAPRLCEAFAEVAQRAARRSDTSSTPSVVGNGGASHSVVGPHAPHASPHETPRASPRVSPHSQTPCNARASRTLAYGLPRST